MHTGPGGGQPYPGPGLAIPNNTNENVTENVEVVSDKVEFHVKNTGIRPKKLIYGGVDMIKNI